jgi:glycosyltransferase involved in cell wall biosynthesis
MKIAIDARELHDKPTGVGRLLRKLLDEWMDMPTAQAHDFISLAPPSNSRGGGTLWEQLTLPRLVREARADVLFAPAYSAPLFSPVPMVIAIHDVSFAAHPEWFAWREGARRRTITRLAARAAARVLTISDFSKREIVAHLGVDASKVRVVYPGLTAFESLGQRRTVAPGTASHTTVLFVGSIFNRRHVPELIEGFARVAQDRPELQLDIVGDNRTTPFVDLEAVRRQTGVAHRIHLRSYVSDDVLRHIYANAAAFIFLSEYEGFGLTPLEALASGLPVVLLDTPVAREVFGDAARYIARPDPVLISEGLIAVCYDAGERERILTASAALLGRYSWTTFAHEVLDLLTEVGSRGTVNSPAHVPHFDRDQ